MYIYNLYMGYYGNYVCFICDEYKRRLLLLTGRD